MVVLVDEQILLIEHNTDFDNLKLLLEIIYYCWGSDMYSCQDKTKMSY